MAAARARPSCASSSRLPRPAHDPAPQRRRTMNGACPRTVLTAALLAVCGLTLSPGGSVADPLPTPAEMAAARRDVWGEAALRQPEGPSYEFFKDLLPPVRYVNTAFRHYPIVLSAPAGPVKARWVS